MYHHLLEISSIFILGRRCGTILLYPLENSYFFLLFYLLFIFFLSFFLSLLECMTRIVYMQCLVVFSELVVCVIIAFQLISQCLCRRKQRFLRNCFLLSHWFPAYLFGSIHSYSMNVLLYMYLDHLFLSLIQIVSWLSINTC